jgi:hypothetical protein
VTTTKGWISTKILPAGLLVRESLAVSKGTNLLVPSILNEPSDRGMMFMGQKYDVNVAMR